MFFDFLKPNCPTNNITISDKSPQYIVMQKIIHTLITVLIVYFALKLIFPEDNYGTKVVILTVATTIAEFINENVIFPDENKCIFVSKKRPIGNKRS